MLSWSSPRRYRQQARDAMVSGLLTPDCTDCRARSGQWCDPVPPEYVLVDKDPPHVVHSTRIVTAADGGHVRRDLLIAQFAGGQLPSGLTRYRRSRSER